MNIPSAASSRRETIEAQRLKIMNMINNAVKEGHFSLCVQDVHPIVLDEVMVQGYEVISEPYRGDGYYLIRW